MYTQKRKRKQVVQRTSRVTNAIEKPPERVSESLASTLVVEEAQHGYHHLHADQWRWYE